ncbi:MAG: hypothetical protein AAGB04_18930 [Pseudomonadota bacterium]
MKILVLNVAVIILLGVIDVALVGAAKQYPSVIIAENGLLENLQLVVLLLTAIVFLSAASRQTGATRTAAIALAGASGAFFFRELDFRGLDLPAHFQLLTSAYVRDPLFIAMVLGIGVYMYIKRQFLREWIAMIFHPRAAVLAAAALFLAAGHLLDDIYGRSIWEEVSEFNGYVLFLTAAINHHSIRQ